MDKAEAGEEREIQDEVEEAFAPQQGVAEAVVLGPTTPVEPSAETSAYLAAQTKLLGVQLEHMHEQRILQLEHLRVRKWRERLHLSLQVLLWALAVPILIGLASLVLWAMNDEALVIQPLKAPPALVAQGLDGTVLATKLLDGVKTLQSQAESARAPSTFKNFGEEDIKVEIPETGVSIGELMKALRAWLGHETQVTGAVYLDDPNLAITVRAGEEPGETFRGPRSDLDHLLEQASEAVLSKTQPYLYAVYLSRHDRRPESLQVTRKLATSGPVKERAWAYAHWANLLLSEGDDRGAAVRARQALSRDPKLVTAENNLAIAEGRLGHDEAALQARMRALALLRPGTPARVTVEAADQLRVGLRASIEETLGDYGQAAAADLEQMELPDFSGDVAKASLFLADDLAEDHDVEGARAALLRAEKTNDVEVLKYLADYHAHSIPHYTLLSALEDWPAAIEQLSTADAWLAQQGVGHAAYRARVVVPHLASALAHTGRLAEAMRLVSGTPLDCVLCLRTRGELSALAGRLAEAEGWYRRAVDAAPSLPRPYLSWGQVLLRAGDSRGAAAKARAAAQRGPHFADAYVLWGEALLAAGDPWQALAKFKTAEQHAPKWGHLHLVSGEASASLSDRSGAAAAFKQAGGLALSAADTLRLKADLQRLH